MRAALAILALALGPAACVERKVSIESVPAGATVWVNDREVGVTPCEFAFTHYGTFDVRVALEGHEPLVTGAEATPPWWDSIPLDLVAEILPARFVSHTDWRFELVPSAVTPEELRRRAEELRDRTAPPATAPAPTGPSPEASGPGAR
jgi:hypothetical protein